MNQEFSRPLVHSQRWKLWLGAAAIGVVATVYVVPERIAELVSLEPVMLELVATTVGLAAMFAVWASVRCPSCGLRLISHAMSTKSANAWLSWLHDARSCPGCGYRPPPRAEDA